MTSTRSVSRRGRTTCVSGSPKRALNSSNIRALRREHEATVQNTTIIDALFAQTGDGALHDVDHGRMLLVGDDGNRRVHAHAARVGAFVVFVGALVILGGRHGNHGDAIGEREHRAFGAGHHLLEDDRGARLAKASVKALANGLVSFLLGERNRYALASRQTVGLDDDGRTLLVKGRQAPSRSP